MGDIVWDLGVDPGAPNSPYTVFFDVLLNGTIVTQNVGGFVLKNGFNTVGFAGNFTVNGSGVITGGTISSIKVAIPAEVLIDASGYAIDFNDFNQALTLAKASQGEPLLLLLFGNPMTVNGSIGPDLMGGGPASDHLYGNAGLDYIDGADGDDFISGGPGVDQIYGGPGSDTADYADKSAPVTVTLNGAVAVTPVQVQVGGTVEDTLLHIENINGGSAGDTITGDDLDNRLVGNAGDDTLSGGLGNDTLNGGPGRDHLVFDSTLAGSANVDAVVGFSHKDDTIDLDNSIFAKLKKDGVLKDKFFHAGKKAADHNDYLLYNKKTGDLSYDGDGDRHKIKPIEFADLDAHLKLTHNDFLVI